MRALSSAQIEALNSPATILATIWTVTRTDNFVLRLTDLDTPVEVGGVLYEPNGATERSSIKLSAGLSVDNLDIKGIFKSGAITASDLLDGRYDYADLVVGIAFANMNLPPIPLISGRFGEVSVDDGSYVVEVNGMMQSLQAVVGEMTTPTCRTSLGSSRCQVSMASWQRTLTVVSVLDDTRFTVAESTALPSGATLASGLLESIQGASAGLRMEVKRVAGSELELYLPLPIPLAAGDVVRAYAGCDKTLETCSLVFSNAVNFQGEPHVPGIDALAAPDVR